MTQRLILDCQHNPIPIKANGYDTLLDRNSKKISTQKAVTTEATNALGEKMHMKICSEPILTVKNIYERLKYKKIRF